jgi:hypothetical protein
MVVRLRLLALVALLAPAPGGCATAQSDDMPQIDAPGPGPDAPIEDIDAALPDDPDARPPDAGIPPTEVVSLSPGTLAISRGAAAMLTVTLDRAALPGGAVVTLESDDPGGTTFTIPTSVTVPAGQSAASFMVTSVAVGGPFDVRASFGSSIQAASVVVVPALLSVGPMGSSDITVGTSSTYVVSLEAASAAPVIVTLSTMPTGIASVPATVTIPMGGATASFPVSGTDLGGPVLVRATVGTATVESTARVLGLYMSEVLYDTAGADTGWEWIELYNASGVDIDVTGFKVQPGVAAVDGYVDALTLAGMVGPGQCVVVGGPNVGATNFTPATFVYFVAGDFSTDLGNAGSASGDPGDGLQIITAAGDIIDNVIYGRNNNDMFTDEDGSPSTAPAVGDAPAGQSIERTGPGLAGPWSIQVTPNPGDCVAISM